MNVLFMHQDVNTSAKEMNFGNQYATIFSN